MKLKVLSAVIALTAASPAFACTLAWDYPVDAIIPDGFNFYQGGVYIGTAGPEDRSIDCVAVGVTRGGGPVTISAFLGEDEIEQSARATFSGPFNGALWFQLP